MLATGIHAQHSTYEADVRARAIPCHGEVVASCANIDCLPITPSRSRAIIYDASLADVPIAAISMHLTKHPLGAAPPACLATEGIARTLILLTMSEVRQRVNRAIADVHDARPYVLVSVHVYK